jgi:two-component system response regulator AtoC
MPSRRRREPALQHLFRTRSPAMRDVLQTVAKVLDRDVSILILGESGTGKDFLAEAIHACGPRREEPFVPIECASIPSDLFESELFGHERGTFTDAHSRKIGKLEMARGGTLYFDEIAALSPNLQAKLLRAVQERSYTRLGGGQPIALEARMISSSNRDADELMAGGLRRDLMYRINVVTITLPPLRARREDIPALAKKFLSSGPLAPPRGERGAGVRGFSEEAMDALQNYSWPGNLRELRNVVQRAAIMAEGNEIASDALPLDRMSSAPALIESATRDRWTLDDLESRYIREVLRLTKSNYSKAAEILGINRKTLLEKRKKYGIE